MRIPKQVRDTIERYILGEEAAQRLAEKEYSRGTILTTTVGAQHGYTHLILREILEVLEQEPKELKL